MLVTGNEILYDARRRQVAVPSPDYFDQQSVRAYIEVAQSLNKPIIIAYSEAFEEYLSIEEAALLGKFYAERASVPVALHVDHGYSIEFIQRCIDEGFTSVMIDASMESFEENVRRTKEVVAYAHKRHVSVEAEIGHVGSGMNYESQEETDSIYTEVSAAMQFVEQTGVDSLAVSIGTAHGKYKGIPVLHFERLRELRKALSIPLVLHGGSSTGDENLKKCASYGISKINLFTDIVTGGSEAIKQSQSDDLLTIWKETCCGMKEVLYHYYQEFG